MLSSFMPTMPQLIPFNHSIWVAALFWLAFPQAYADPATNRISLTASHNDNVGLTSWEEDRISDNLLTLDFARSYRKTLGISDSLSYGANLGAREYYDYPCDRINFGVQFGYEKKLGLGFDKPRLSIFWNGERRIYQDGNRDGHTSEVDIRISKPFNERLDMALRLSKLWEIPDNSPASFGIPEEFSDLPSDAFNLETTTAEISAEYFATQNWSLLTSLGYTDGDLVSISRGRLPNFQYADAATNDEAVGPDWFAYRSEGEAWAFNIAASRVMNDGSLLNFEFEYLDATTGGEMEYDNKVFNISWVKNW